MRRNRFQTILVFVLVILTAASSSVLAVQTRVTEALRRSFLRDYGYAWRDASPGVQESYLKEFNRRQKEIKRNAHRAERNQLRKIRDRDRQIRRKKREISSQEKRMRTEQARKSRTSARARDRIQRRVQRALRQMKH